MEVKTGEIKAIVNLRIPWVLMWKIIIMQWVKAQNLDQPFKLASLISAMEDGYVDLEDTVNTGNGVFQYYDFT